VTPATSGAAITGNVDFEVGGTSIGSTTVVDGSATLTTSFADAGNQAVKAVYGGDSTYNGSSSTSQTIAVSPAVDVSISNASGAAITGGQVLFPVNLSVACLAAVTFSYSLTPGTAVAGDYQAGGDSITVPAGTTQVNIPVNILADSTDDAETFTITLAALSDDAVFSSGNSTATATGTISPAGPVATTTVLGELRSTVALDGTDTFTATVTPATAGATLTGTVNFEAAGVSIGTAVTGDSAVLTPSFTVPGNEVITAVYSGDSNYLTSTSNAVTISVATAPTLAPTVARNTLATDVVSGTVVHATVTVSVDNVTTGTEKGAVTISLYASPDGSVDSSAVLIALVKKNLTIKSKKTAMVPISIKAIPSNLAAGTYSLISQTVDISKNISTAATGPTLTVAAPVIALSEDFNKFNLPATAVAGAKTSAAATLNITNNGNIPSVGTTTISLYASPDGTIASGTVIKTITRKLTIRAGRATPIRIPLGAFPKLTAGTYSIIAEVTDPNGNTSSVVFASRVVITVD
jgi:hypothetical protein